VSTIAARRTELEFEMVSCPICAAESCENLLDQDRHGFGLKTVLCRRCAFVYVNPMPTAKSLEEFYKESYRVFYRKQAQVNALTLAVLGVNERVAATYDYLSRTMDLPRLNNILDFGSADGSLLKYIQEHHPDIRLCGVEPSAEYRKFAKDRLRAEIFEDITAIPRHEKYDLIIINHVLEHLAEPIGFLRTLIDLLSERGALYIDVPNLSAYKTYDDIHIAHVGHYTVDSMRNLAAMVSMEIRSMEEHRPANHPASLRCIIARSDSPEVLQVPSDLVLANIRGISRAIHDNRHVYRLKQLLSRYMSVGRARRFLRRLKYSFFR
jgi:2-polyprenyl-3-methyl-5-hydroxy-6-metoxy-1,4-benzoquinol methylase